MSDNEDLLGDDLGDQSLADYNLGNEEEEQLLADDYESGGPQNVPTSLGPGYREPDMLPPEYPVHPIEYGRPISYQPVVEPECVVPNITVEIPNTPIQEHPTYAPYEPPIYNERTVPPAMPAIPMESPQIVPTDIQAPMSNGDMGGPRERFVSERPPGVQRMPQIRDIPDSLDKVVIPRGGYGVRGRMMWNRVHYTRFNHPYRRNNMHRGNYHPRATFPPPPQVRPAQLQIRAKIHPDMRPDMRPQVRTDLRPAVHPDIRLEQEIHPDMRPDMPPDVRPDTRPDIRPDMRSDLRPDMRPDVHPDMRPDFRPDMRPDVRPDVDSDMHPDIHPDMRPDIRPDMRVDNRPDMRPDIRPDMRPDIRPDMLSDIHPDMRLDIRAGMRPDIRPDMRSDIRPDMRQDIRPDMRLDVRPDMRQDIRPDMRPDIRHDMRPDIRHDMRPDIRIDMRPDIRPDMRPEMRSDMRPDIIHPEMPPNMRPDLRDVRPDIRPDLRQDIRREMPPDMLPDVLPPGVGPDMLPRDIRPDMAQLPPIGLEVSAERPLDMLGFRERPYQPGFPRQNYRPTLDERPHAPNIGPNVRPYEPQFLSQYPRHIRPFGPPMREIAHNNQSHLPQVTIRQPLPIDKPAGEPEVRMLPVPIPPNLPVTGKKVLINPHFKGTLQPLSEGLPAYIPTRIQKSPPLSPTLKEKFGPIKDLDDATERFIAEQRNALARAAGRKFPRRSPQRYIENTTIEIENDLAHTSGKRRSSEDDLSRRQEEFINANRAGLRRRMRSPSPPPRRSPSPLPPPPTRRTPEKRPRTERADLPLRRENHNDEDNEYRRRLREQESLRERVLRAKEVRRKKNAVALQKQTQERERENQEKEMKLLQKVEDRRPVQKTEDIRPIQKLEVARPVQKVEVNRPIQKVEVTRPVQKVEVTRPIQKVEVTRPIQKVEVSKPEMVDKPTSTEDHKPDTTRRSPEKPVIERVKVEKVEKSEWSPIRQIKEEEAEVNSTCEGLTPPHPQTSPERALTPPLPPHGGDKDRVQERDKKREWLDSDDDLDMILGDIDGILSDEEDSGRFKQKADKMEPLKSKPQVDLRSKLPPKLTANSNTSTTTESKKPARQKIVFNENKERDERKKRDKSPQIRPVVSSSTKTEGDTDKKAIKAKSKSDLTINKSRQKIMFNSKEQRGREAKDDKKSSASQQSNRRVILQRKVQVSPKEKSVFSRIDSDPSQPHAGIFSRAVRTAIGADNTRIVVKRQDEPQIEYGSDSDLDEDSLLDDDIGNVAHVANLPYGMTDTRLNTLAGNDVQSLNLNKEERKAKIIFKTTVAAESFKKKFNNKMVAASRLSVTLG